MEDNKNQVNLPPAGGEPQEEEKKKRVAPVLFGRGAGARGGWGVAMLAKLGASKAAVVAAAIGVTAIAGLATMTVSSKKADVGGGSGEMLAFSPYERYTPGAGRGGDSAVFPLPYAEGNQTYKDELYAASVSPDSTQSESAAEYDAAAAAAAAAEALPSAGGAGAASLRGGASGSTAAGGGGASVMSAGGKNAGASAKSGASGAAAQAKSAASKAGARGGAAVKQAGNNRASRMATGGLGSMAGKAGAGTPLVGSAELAKARSDVKFGETPVAGSGSSLLGDTGGASGAASDGDAYETEMPEAPSDTSTASSPAGGGAATGEAEELAAMAQTLKDLVKESQDLLQELLDTAADPAKLCAEGAMAGILETFSEKSNEIIEHLDKMGEARAMTPAKVANWKCNVVMQMLDVVSTFTTDTVGAYCEKYNEKEMRTKQFNSCANQGSYASYCYSQVGPSYNAAITNWNNAQAPFVEAQKPILEFKSQLGTTIGLNTLLMMDGMTSTSTSTSTSTDTVPPVEVCRFEVQS